MKRRATPINGALLDVKAAAAYLGGSERWLRRLVQTAGCPIASWDGKWSSGGKS